MKAEDWIKVEDKMPEVDTDVLVYDDFNGIIMAYYDKEEGWMSPEYGLLNQEDVTHWMPIVSPSEDYSF